MLRAPPDPLKPAAGSERSMAAFVGSRIVVTQTSFLGDVVLTTPLLKALRRLLKPRSLSIIVRPEAVPLLAAHPSVDRVLVDDKHGADRGLLGILRVAERLKAEGADLAVSPHRSLRTAVVLALAGIPWRVGFQESVGSTLYHATVKRDRSLHDVLRNLELVRAFGSAPAEHLEPPSLHPTDEAEAAAERLLAERGIECDRVLYGVCPGSVWPTKRWVPEGFAEVVRRLVTEREATVLLLGGPGDREVAATVQRLAGSAAIDLTGTTDLGTFTAIVRRLRALVCNDSAPMHVASALGVPVVAIFCATTPAQGFGPYGSRSAVLGADLECRPCAAHGSAKCPRGTEDCMRLVGAEEVLSALSEIALAPALAVEGIPDIS